MMLILTGLQERVAAAAAYVWALVFAIVPLVIGGAGAGTLVFHALVTIVRMALGLEPQVGPLDALFG